MRKFIFVLAVAGCAGTMPVAQAPTVTQASRDVLVCLDHGAISEGEQVSFSRRVCYPVSQKIRVGVCTIQPTASGTVIHVEDERCALVRVAAGNDVRKGDEVRIASRSQTSAEK